MELDPRYVDVIVRRWQDWTGKSASRETDGVAFDDLAAKHDAGLSPPDGRSDTEACQPDRDPITATAGRSCRR